MKQNLPAILLGLALLPPQARSEPVVRLTELGKSSARLVVTLDEPGEIEVLHGELPFEWTGQVASQGADGVHELRLTKLPVDRAVFYQVLQGGTPLTDVLTFRSGRSWVTRRLAVLVASAPPTGGPEDLVLGERIFEEQADVLIALGGDGGDESAFVDMFRRSLADRLVLETGGSSDPEPLSVVAQSDVALALAGRAALVDEDGRPTADGRWVAGALGTVEGACWRVLASALSVEPGTAAAAAWRRLATEARVDVLVTRGVTAGVEEAGELTWLRLPESTERLARLRFEDGRLSAEVEGVGEAGSRSRECPLPDLTIESAFDPGLDGLGEDSGGLSDLAETAEECDTE